MKYCQVKLYRDCPVRRPAHIPDDHVYECRQLPEGYDLSLVKAPWFVLSEDELKARLAAQEEVVISDSMTWEEDPNIQWIEPS